MKGHGAKRMVMVAEVAVVLLILALVNFLATRLFARADLTKDKMYTLAPASREVVRTLPDVLNVGVYISSKVPAQVLPLVNDTRDLLAEYEAYGNANFRVKYYDPTVDQKALERAKGLGIQEIQVQVIEKEGFNVQKAWLGISVEYGDKKEVIPSVTAVDNLEYELTSAIVKVTNEKLPKIGILEIRGPQMQGQQPNRYNSLRSLLSSQFDVVSVNFDAEEKIPEDVTVLFISDTWGISEFGKYLIDQFLMRGGKIVWLIDGITIGQGLQAYPSLPGIEEMMRKWGVDLDRRLLLDVQCDRPQIPTGPGMVVMLPYYPWIKILAANMSDDFPPTAQLEGATFYWASPIKPNPPADAQFKVSTIMSTTEDSWLMESPYNLDPLQSWEGTERKELGRHSVAVYSSGIFPSFFAGQEAPAPVKPSEGEGDDLVPPVEIPEKVDLSIEEGAIVAIGNARFASDEYLQQDRGENSILLLNIADFLGYGDKLIGIRSRGTTTLKMMPGISPATRNVIKTANLILVPLLVILYGIARFFMKRASRARIAARYAPAGDAK
ncbi:MAG: GldG family protein [bacterium]|jgi:gliding-associated putative ABC transporter substrate-binding component GldG